MKKVIHGHVGMTWDYIRTSVQAKLRAALKLKTLCVDDAGEVYKDSEMHPNDLLGTVIIYHDGRYEYTSK